MKTIYICHTNYHLLITLIKYDFNSKKTNMYLFNGISKKAILNLKRAGVSVTLEKESIKSFDIDNDTNIYIYNDLTNIGNYLRKKKINYNLIEDGYNYYSYNIYKKYKSYISIKRKIYNFLFYNSLPLGYSQYAISIEVNDKSILSNKDSRYKKMVEVPRKYLLKNINEDRKKFILDIFDVKPMKYLPNKKSILILTQPLYQDNFDKEIINSENDQINYYKFIVDSYREEYIVYFKVHPRDNTNYTNLNSDNVIFLDKDVPMELYEFVGDYKFDIGITHSSTALDYLSFVKEKIFLGNIN